VVGVGIGEKYVEDQATGMHAIKFLVRIKYPSGQLGAHDLLPASIDGLPTDVEEVGLIRPLAAPPASRRKHSPPINPRVRLRPAEPGCSVGFADPSNQFVMAGTFGSLVKRADGSVFILSNNHVLADEGQLPKGAPIYQPGLLDLDDPAHDQVAELTAFVPLQAATFNDVDCALARVLDPTQVVDTILQIGAPSGTAPAALDMIVEKFGRTTGYRAGRITSLDTDITITYDTGNFTFESQIVVVGLNRQAFSAAGDSGSLIVERQTKKAVGLLFAGSSSHTIANHLDKVLAALQVELA
jgi:hypothetical protein